MKDPRVTQMAKNLIHNSIKLQPGENLLIEVTGTDFSLTKELIAEAYATGAQVFVTSKNPEIEALVLAQASEEQIRIAAQYELERMEKMQAYIAVRGNDNTHSGDGVPPEKGTMYRKLFYSPVHLDERVKHTKWVICRVPNHSMAQNSCMSTDAMEDFYYDCCSLDYAKMREKAEPLQKLLAQADIVRITGKDTDLSFSVKGMPANIEAGESNMPGGEVCSAPLKYSVNGQITYNLPTSPSDPTPVPIRLTFKDGKIIDVHAKNAAELNRIFDTDEGGRYVGEFAIGINPKITKIIGDTLFDEKMCGSLHVTPGNCYEICDNGNYSAIHMDMIYIQTPEFGGGDIWFDDILIRRDGLFVPEALQGLNPGNW